MKKFRIVSLLLVVLLALGSLASCGEVTTEALFAGADLALLSDAYTADVEMKYTCTNPEIKEIIEAFNGMELEMAYDNGNVYVKTGISTSISDVSMEVETSYVIVDNMAYLKYEMKMYGQSQVVKQKAALTNEQKLEFIDKNLKDMSFGLDDFEQVERKEADGATVVTCKGIKEESAKAIVDIVEAQLSAIEGEIAVKDVVVVFEIENGRYEEITLSCTYEVSYEGGSFSFGLTMEMDYDYEKTVEIKAPVDASTYEYAEFSDIIGD